MKRIPLFLALSLAANAAFLVTFFFRPAVPGGVGATGVHSARDPAPATNRLGSAQLAALASGDSAQLKAANLPDDIIRDLSLGRAYNRLQEQLRAMRTPATADDRYWQNTGMGSRSLDQSKEQRAEMARIQREFADAVRDALGVDASPGGFVDTRYEFLPAAKRDQLRRIEQDYNEMQREIYGDMGGIQLPSDREKLKLLRQEQARDIAATLSPEEFEQYNLRMSPSATAVRYRYGDAIQTEDDYRKIFALQKAYDDQYSAPEQLGGGPPTPEFLAARRAADAKLQEDIRSAIGEDNYAALLRASDQEYKALGSVAKRLNLPATTADSVFATRETYAVQSQQINRDPSLSAQDRKAQLKSLAERARADLQAALGPEGAEAYAQRASWLNFLKNGTAFSSNPKDAPGARLGTGSSVFPVAAPGSTVVPAFPLPRN